MTLFEMTAAASLLIFVVILLRLLFLYRLPKKLFLFLWGLVLYRALLPFALPFSGSAYTLLQRAPLPKNLFHATPSNVAPFPYQAPAEAAVRLEETSSVLLHSPDFLLVLWGTGAVLCAVFFLGTHLRCRKRYDAALPLQTPWITAWQAQQTARRRIHIRQSDQITTPLTYGLIRPVVLLPKSMANASPWELRMVLTHEYTHIRRFDILTKYLLAVALCVHWFNPLFWEMYLLANQDLEIACDETVVRTLGVGAKADYARALVRLEEQKFAAAPLCSRFSQNVLEERIKAIMKLKKQTIYTRFLAATLLAGTAALFATSAYAQQDQAETIPLVSLPADTATTFSPAEQDYIWPVRDGGEVTLNYGPLADHICIGGMEVDGSDILAVADGQVIAAAFDSEKGNYITLSHGTRAQTTYTHCGTLLVKVGDQVQQGAAIATLGRTGMATGPCLGFTFVLDGETQNPLDYIEE